MGGEIGGNGNFGKFIKENKMINQQQINQIENKTPPKWLLIIFRVCGGIFAIGVIIPMFWLFFFVIYIGSEWSGSSFIESLLFVFFSEGILLVLYNILLSIVFFIVSFGSWYLKRWIIPLYLISFLGALILIFNSNDPDSLIIGVFGLLISGTLFIIAYCNRRYFS